MKNNIPLILISNDDGFQAKGIRSLVDMLRGMGRIIVCAPDSPRSGYACAFSATWSATFLRVSRPSLWASTFELVSAASLSIKFFHCSSDCRT